MKERETRNKRETMKERETRNKRERRKNSRGERDKE